MDLADLSASELARCICDGEVTSLQAIDACISRIESLEPEVQAWARFDPAIARQQAERCDMLRASGAPLGPLHGVPVGIKDIFDTKDFPTENGTVLDAGRQPDEDCEAVARLKAAGCVIMGKTVTTELAVYAPGKTTNPHDPRRTPGGSSSGSAAAVACGMVPLAIGSQTNGSVIRPASFCGVVGYKPSHGRISRTGVLSLSRQLDHVGVFARTVEDAALIGDCLSGFDAHDPDTRPQPAPRLRDITLQAPPVPPKFGFIKTVAWEQADPSTQAAFAELVDFLGPDCDEITPPDGLDLAVTHLRTLMTTDLAYSLRRYTARGKDQLSDILQGMIEEGEQARAVDYKIAMEARRALNAWMDDMGTIYDAFITPATVGEAPEGLDATGDPVFCSTWTYLGVPAVTVPLMQGDNNMPLGVQLVSAGADDARLLRNARWLAEEVADADDA